MPKKTLNLTEGNIYKVLLAFIVPIILGSLIQQLYTTVDAVIVGQFTGKSGLAAIDSVHTLFKFPINFMNGLSAGATILISRHFGSQDKKHLYSCVRAAYTLALVLGAACAVLGVILTPQLLEIMSVPADIYDWTRDYCQIYFGGLAALVLYNMLTGILRAFGDTKRPLYVLAVSSVVNIIGDILLVGVFGFGVAGAAAATVFSECLSVVLTYIFLAQAAGKEGEKAMWRPRFDMSHMSRMVRIGIPLALQSVLFPVANSIVQASVNGRGTDSIAAWGVCAKLELVIWLLADAMSPALSTYTSQNIGANRIDRVKKGVFMGAGMSVSCIAAISAILYFISGFIGKWFISANDAADIIPLVIRYMHMMAPFYIFYAAAEAFSGACCGTGDTIKPMITTLTSICLLRVLSIWFVLPHYNTMECIVWIYIASWIAAGAAFTLLYLYEILHPEKFKQKM